MIEHDILGEIVKKSRLDKGLSQEQLAELLNCSPRHIIGIENGQNKPSYWRLYTLVRTLNIPTEAIFYPEHNNVTYDKNSLIKEFTKLLYMCDEDTIKILMAAAQEAIHLK